MRYSYYYFLLPILLFVLQAVYTLNSMNQIRVEELDETVRNVFWLQNSMVFSSISRDQGWYAQLLVLYNIFGFDLFLAKYYRLFLHLLSLISLAWILKKYLGAKLAWLPLLTIGLSPTILYFTLLGNPYGIDFQFLPILIYLTSSLDYRKKVLFIFKQLLFWVLLMIAWLSYPVLLFYYPVLMFFNVKILFNNIKILKLRKIYLILSVAFFLLPLILLILFIKKENGLFSTSYIFSGAGEFSPTLGTIAGEFKHNFYNLFIASKGYYMELSKVEFSDFYPILLIPFLVFFAVKLFKKYRKLRIYVLLVLFTLLTNAFFGNMTANLENGLRRSTPLIASFYFFFILGCFFIGKEKNIFKRAVFISVILLLPLHHIIAYPINLSFLDKSREFSEKIWFVQKTTPRQSFKMYLDTIKHEDLNVYCLNQKDSSLPCRYDLLFAAVSGACKWNNLKCKKINVFHPEKNSLEALSIHSK